MHVPAWVNYHIKSDAPQAFEFDVDGIVGNLISPDLTKTKVDVTDLRDARSEVSFDQDGILFLHHPTEVSDFSDERAWRSVYDAELIRLLQTQIGAKEVIVFDHTVRVDDPDAPRQPARNVHNDYNTAGAERRLIDLVGKGRAEDFQEVGYGFVNVWRPIEHVIQSSPLGFIRPASMVADDWMDIGLIYPDRFGQILGVAANPNHEWFYKSRMTPEELVLFNIYDSTGRPHLAHSALDMDGDDRAPVPRKSIESRTLVRYA